MLNRSDLDFFEDWCYLIYWVLSRLYFAMGIVFLSCYYFFDKEIFMIIGWVSVGMLFVCLVFVSCLYILMEPLKSFLDFINNRNRKIHNF